MHFSKQVIHPGLHSIPTEETKKPVGTAQPVTLQEKQQLFSKLLSEIEGGRDGLPYTAEEAPAPLDAPLSLGLDTVLLIICSSNRPDYLRRTLEHVVKHHPRTSVPIVISQDDRSPAVDQVIDAARAELAKVSSVAFIHVHHSADSNIRYENGYFKLADHFKWALDQVFTNDQLFSADASSASLHASPVQRVIILEEDLEIAPDFFEFFAATAHLLDADPSVLAVSAWNDNGMQGLVRQPEALYRSDFFPGLGWMMSRRLWTEELSAKWPRAYWDDWLREPKQRQGRHIIRPEICRTLHFGTHGVSNAQYSDFLTTIKLNDHMVQFTKLDLGYLEKEAWDRQYLDSVRNAPLVSREEFNSYVGRSGAKEVRVSYNYLKQFPSVALWAGAMDNIKANVPRTAYKGIVSVWKGDVKLHLVPKEFA